MLAFTHHMICSGLVAGPSGRADCIRSLAGLRFQIPPVTWMFVFCECCVLSDTGLWFGLITRPEESCWVWCVWVWWQSLDKKRSWPTVVCTAMKNKGFGEWNLTADVCVCVFVCVCVSVWSLRFCFLVGEFGNLRKAAFSFVVSVCLPVCTHGTTSLP